MKAKSALSDMIQELLDRISPSNQAQTTARMVMQTKIYNGIKAKGWTYTYTAERMGVKPDTVSKWIHGDIDIKLSTLAALEVVLDIKLLNQEL